MCVNLYTCLSCRKLSVKIKVKYFLTVHYFVVIMSTFPYCQYINVSVVIIVEYSRQFTVLYGLYIYILFGQKLQHFSNDAFESYYDLFQVN